MAEKKYQIERSNLYQVRKQTSDNLGDVDNRLVVLENSSGGGGIVLNYKFSSALSGAVASGYIATDSANTDNVTEIRASATSESGNDLSTIIQSLQIGDSLFLIEQSAPNGQSLYDLTAVPILISGYYTIAVTPIEIAGDALPQDQAITNVSIIEKRITDHADLNNVTENQHHNKAHSHDGADGSGTVSHSSTTGKTQNDHHKMVHAHTADPEDGGQIPHGNLTDVTSDQHHPQIHDLQSHSDVTLLLPLKGAGLWFDTADNQWKNRASATEAWNTGMVSGGELNIGAVLNEIEVIAGLGVVVDSYTAPIAPSSLLGLEWDTINEPITVVPSVAGSVVWFSMADTGTPTGDKAGDIVINVGEIKQYAQSPTPSLARQEIFLGVAIHNGSVWKEISNPKVINQAAETLREVATTVLPLSNIISGGTVSEQASFTLSQLAGVIWENNRNWHNDASNPNQEALPPSTPIQFQYVNRDFTDVGSLTPSVESDMWDNAGTVEAIGGPANNTTIQRLYLDPANNYWMLWGQNVYPTWLTAAASIGYDGGKTVVPFILQKSILLGYVISTRSEVDWSTGAAVFSPAGSLTAGIGGGGTPITQHDSLTGITTDNHHNKLHGITDPTNHEFPTSPVGDFLADDGTFKPAGGGTVSNLGTIKSSTTVTITNTGGDNTSISGADNLNSGIMESADYNFLYGLVTSGSWTPTLENVSRNYNDQSGFWQRVGNVVTAQFRLAWRTLGNSSSNAVTIGGLPFNSVFNEENMGGFIHTLSGADFGGVGGASPVHIGLRVRDTGVNQANLYYSFSLSSDDQAGQANPASYQQLATTGVIEATIIYRVP